MGVSWSPFRPLSVHFQVSRLLLVAFLEERNAELARSIRRAARETDAPVVAVLGGLHVAERANAAAATLQ